MAEEKTPRIRINAKETSKGEWYFEATVETEDQPEGKYAVDVLRDTIICAEDQFRAVGKKLVKNQQ